MLVIRGSTGAQAIQDHMDNGHDMFRQDRCTDWILSPGLAILDAHNAGDFVFGFRGGIVLVLC